MIKISSTQDYQVQGVKCLVHSKAGVGKTYMCSTAPAPLIISNESGLLALKEFNIPVIEVKSILDIGEAYRFLTQSNEAKAIQTICMDSLSEIAEVVLIEYKQQFTDARQAYGKLNDDIAAMIRLFRDIRGKHVYFTAKQLKFTDDDNGIVQYVPGMPGKTLLYQLPFFFDLVFALHIGVTEDQKKYRYLQTQPSIKFEAKDRSGKLDEVEPANLNHVFAKVMATTTTQEKEK